MPTAPTLCSPLAPFAVGGAAGRGAVVRGWEVEITGWAAQVQDGAAGSREGVEGGGQGCAELLRVVPGVVLRDHLLQAGQGLGGPPPAPPDVPGAGCAQCSASWGSGPAPLPRASMPCAPGSGLGQRSPTSAPGWVGLSCPATCESLRTCAGSWHFWRSGHGSGWCGHCLWDLAPLATPPGLKGHVTSPSLGLVPTPGAEGRVQVVTLMCCAKVTTRW